MAAGSSQDLLIWTWTRKCKDLLQDFITIFTASSHKDLYKTWVKIFIYYGPLRLHPSREFRRSLYQDLRQSAKISAAPQPERSETHTHKCPEGCASDIKIPPRHNQSDLTRTKWREGCAYHNSHRATTRAIRHAQSHERVVWAHVRFSQKHCAYHETWTLKVQREVLPRSQQLFCWGTKYSMRLPRKWARGIRSAAPATRNHHVESQKWQHCHKTRLSTLSKPPPSSPNTAPATPNDLQKHLSFWPRLVNVLATYRKYHACPISCACHAKTTF